MIAMLRSGEPVRLTLLLDRHGNETDDPELAVTAIAETALGERSTLDLARFDLVTIN